MGQNFAHHKTASRTAHTKRCSKCHKPGHDKRTCGTTPAPPPHRLPHPFAVPPATLPPQPSSRTAPPHPTTTDEHTPPHRAGDEATPPPYAPQPTRSVATDNSFAEQDYIDCYTTLWTLQSPLPKPETFPANATNFDVCVKVIAVVNEFLAPIPPEWHQSLIPHIHSDLTQYREGIRRAIARFPDTPAGIARQLASDTSARVRRAAVRHPQFPAEALPTLLRDRSVFVRAQVLSHPDTPPELLPAYANDRSYLIRAHLAMHPKCPQPTLEHLANNAELYIKQNVADNPNTPPATARRLREYLSPYYRGDITAQFHGISNP